MNLLFISLISIVLIAKRKMLGCVIYLLTYGVYFGIDVYNHLVHYCRTGGVHILKRLFKRVYGAAVGEVDNL